MGLANYYRWFFEGYAEVAAPLTALGSPTARFEWTDATQASFEALKQALSKAPVLLTFDPAALGAHDGCKRDRFGGDSDTAGVGRRRTPAPDRL